MILESSRGARKKSATAQRDPAGSEFAVSSMARMVGRRSSKTDRHYSVKAIVP
jgi:hypothetical protein